MILQLITNNSTSGSNTHHSPFTIVYSLFTIHETLAKHRFLSPDYFAKRHFPSPLGEVGFDKVEFGRGGEGARLSRSDEVFSSLIADHSPLTIA
jgi:hypothetical protein